MSNYPIPIPASLTFRNVAGKTSPLSSLEIDGNFAFLDNRIESKLDKTALSAQAIKSLLLDPIFSQNNSVNATELRGLQPSSEGHGNSVVIRDSDGNFSAGEITARLKGNADTSTQSNTALKLKTPIQINGVPFDGSAPITIYDVSKVSKSGDSVSGKISSSASVPVKFIVNSSLPVNTENGDIWLERSGLRMNLNGSVREISFLDSDISGKSSNIYGILSVRNGGTGTDDAQQARINLGAAAKGANSDITSITGLTTPLHVNQGGTGINEPGEAGNIMVSSGTGYWNLKKIDIITTNISEKIIDNKLPSALTQYLNRVIGNYNETGHLELPGGILLNWGKFNINDPGKRAVINGKWVLKPNSQIVVFDKPYKNAVFAFSIGVDNAASQMIGVINKNKNNMTIQLGSGDRDSRSGTWFTIGI